MFISIVLNTEYMDIASRSKWYLKNLLHCKENGWILITHEYMRTHWSQLQEEITPSLFSSWEMQPFAAEDVTDVEQYFIPDELFEAIEKQCGSRTEMLWQLSTTNNTSIEKVLHNIISEIKLKHLDEPIEGVFHCLETWYSLRSVCEEYKIPIIPYTFSAIRKPHGYRQTLYLASINSCLNSTQQSSKRYHGYLSQDNDSIPVFSNREIITILGKDRTLPLLPLINAEPKYEMGLCTECFSIVPQFLIEDHVTDDDVRYECEKHYNKSQITVRNHSLQVDYMQLDRTTVHNDPAAWILSCRRVAASRSQIGLKILLWKRTAFYLSNSLAFTFMCEKECDSIKTADIKALNYYIFCYLIPNDLMFSDKYWKWRMTNPTELEIYKYHLDFYINKLNISQSVLTENDMLNRFKSLLISRVDDKELIKILLEDRNDYPINYNTACSRILVNNKSYWRLNHIEDGICNFHIELEEPVNTIDFYPLDDVAGCSRLLSIEINNQLLDVTQYSDFKYMPKTFGHYTIPVTCPDKNLIIDIKWEYMSNDDFLKKCQ